VTPEATLAKVTQCKAVEETAKATAKKKMLDGGIRRISVIGPQGIGRGQLAEDMSKSYGLPHLTVAEILHHERVSPGSNLAGKLTYFLDHGRTVPEKMKAELVAKALETHTNGFVLDGYPWTVSEAEAAAQAGITLDRTIVLRATAEFQLARLGSRRVDPVTGRVHDVERHPPSDLDLLERLIPIRHDEEGRVRKRINRFENELESLGAVVGSTLLGGPRSDVAADEQSEASLLEAASAVLEGRVNAEDAMHDIENRFKLAAEEETIERHAVDKAAKAHKLIFLLGAPGSGKAALATRLGKEYGLEHLKIETLLLEEIYRETSLREKLQFFVKRGLPIPVRLMIKLILHAIDRSSAGGWVIDGFPSTKQQWEEMQKHGLLPERVFVIRLCAELQASPQHTAPISLTLTLRERRDRHQRETNPAAHSLCVCGSVGRSATAEIVDSIL